MRNWSGMAEGARMKGGQVLSGHIVEMLKAEGYFPNFFGSCSIFREKRAVGGRLSRIVPIVSWVVSAK